MININKTITLAHEVPGADKKDRQQCPGLLRKSLSFSANEVRKMNAIVGTLVQTVHLV